jgi:hypothetical protein
MEAPLDRTRDKPAPRKPANQGFAHLRGLRSGQAGIACRGKWRPYEEGASEDCNAKAVARSS